MQKKIIITLAFEKNANFFAENWQKLAKIVIITSTPGHSTLHLDDGVQFGFVRARNAEDHVDVRAVQRRQHAVKQTEEKTFF
jgi:hypothetical protein